MRWIKIGEPVPNVEISPALLTHLFRYGIVVKTFSVVAQSYY